MKDEQLLQFDEKQARQQLNDQQLERYNELKKQKLADAIGDKREKDGELRLEAVKKLKKSKKRTPEVVINGLTFMPIATHPQTNKLKKLEEHEDEKLEDLSDKKIESLKSDLIEVLADLNQDYNLEDWQDHFGDASILTIASLAYDLKDAVEKVNDKRSTVKKWAGKDGASIVRVMQYTNFKTPLEYIEKTSYLERIHLAEAVQEFEKEENERSSKILNALFGK